MKSSFSLARLPRIEFGTSCRNKLPDLARSFGKHFLLVIGKRSFVESIYWDEFTRNMLAAGFSWEQFVISSEPSPQLVDDAVTMYRSTGIEFVLGIGGGSVLDAGKAIAGLLALNDSVMDYLEGVGPEKTYIGPALPYIAVPTTAGTGSEATKNAVLSTHGKSGFKKSFRDEQLVAQYAVIDPDLYASCPPGLIAANGMDAFTQLLESFVSLGANPFTDALAISGLEAIRDGLLAWYENRPNAAAAREKMAYAALLSGITLAQTGLGSVHGLASPLGAFFPIPHGIVCGTLMAEATDVNIAAMNDREENNPALVKYVQAAALFTGKDYAEASAAHNALVELLRDWTRRLQLPRLGQYGITIKDFPEIVANCRGSSMKTNPIVLTDKEIGNLLQARL